MCTPVFIAALFTIVKRWKHYMCPPIEGWINKMWHTHTRENYSAKKGMKSDTCYQMCYHNRVEPQKHGARWNKPDVRHNYCMLPFRWCQLTETERRWEVTRLGREEEIGSYCLMGKELLFGVMENLEIVMKVVPYCECNQCHWIVHLLKRLKWHIKIHWGP